MGTCTEKRRIAIKAAFGMLIVSLLLTSCAVPEKNSPEGMKDTAIQNTADDREADRELGNGAADAAAEHSSEEPESTTAPNAAEEQEADPASGDGAIDAAMEHGREIMEIVENMVTCYGTYGLEADQTVEDYLQELELIDPGTAVKWRRIMTAWTSLDTELVIQYNVLPDGLPDTDELCIVALGFQLNADGTMRSELVGRLEVVKNSAEKYPNAWIVCTGGGTAAFDPFATEAGRMAEWLIGQGIDESRILVEDRSLTTVQNALFTYELLSEKAPQVTKLAILSSDYHIVAGTLLFKAEAILRARSPEEQKITVLANAAYPAPSGSLTPTFQTQAMIELARNVYAAGNSS